MTTQDERGVLGCRCLATAEVALLNDVKTLEAAVNTMIDRLRSTGGIDQRQVSIAQTEAEHLFFRLCRAVECPERLVVSDAGLSRLVTVAA